MELKYEYVFTLAFLVLSMILLCNLNGFVYLITGIRAPFSPLILLICFVMLYVGLFLGSIKLNSTELILIIGFYVSYLFLGWTTYVWNPDYLHSSTSLTALFRSYLSSIIIISTFFVGVKYLIPRWNLELLLKVFFFFSLISVSFTALAPVIGLASIYSYAGEGILRSDREFGIFANPNEAGAFSCYFICLLLASYSIIKKSAWVFLALLPLAFYTILISFSRASIAIGLVLVIFYMIFNVRFIFNKSKFNLSKSAFFVVLFLMVFSYAAKKSIDYFQSLSYAQQKRLLQITELLSGEINSNTTSERSEIYAYAWEQIKLRPIFGYGLGTYHKIKDGPFPKAMGAHNTHLMIFAESGVLPIALFTFTYFVLGVRGWMHPIPGIGFLICSVTLVYFFNVAGAGHNALDDRTSNALVGSCIALLSLRKKTE